MYELQIEGIRVAITPKIPQASWLFINGRERYTTVAIVQGVPVIFLPDKPFYHEVGWYTIGDNTIGDILVKGKIAIDFHKRIFKKLRKIAISYNFENYHDFMDAVEDGYDFKIIEENNIDIDLFTSLLEGAHNES